VVRLNGPVAGSALVSLSGALPAPRLAKLCRFRDPESGGLLDSGLALWFPGPASVTGEDLAELHLHGGRAVVAAMFACLGRMPGLRPATAGEFTRRAFENGRIDLAEAEGLADLLAAETESQRQSALLLAEGALGKQAEAWRKILLGASAQIEAALDFSDEGDVGDSPEVMAFAALAELSLQIAHFGSNQPAERLRDGVRVVVAGPPNAGKSSLINALADRDVAIVSEIAGTTRDRIEVPLAIDGVPIVLTDTAGLRGATKDRIEAIGIARAEAALAEADVILWLGEAADIPAGDHVILIAAKSDLGKGRPGLAVSTLSEEGLPALRMAIAEAARALLPKPGTLALNARHRVILLEMQTEIEAARAAPDLLVTAEHLRHARAALDRLTGRAGVEDMLDALFGAFCVGK
jgi:tRNA modification GTPase